jgi:hypothetical protein
MHTAICKPKCEFTVCHVMFVVELDKKLAVALIFETV